jgi:hypothetical protein
MKIQTKRILDTKNYLNNQIILHCPNEADVKTAYNQLSSTGCVEISSSISDLSSVLYALETNAFWGISIYPVQKFARGVKLIAFKGGNEPCYDTGKSAIYCGGAYAAYDDDQHLLFGEKKVCEKTAGIYCLPIYKKWVIVTGENSELISLLHTSPVPFDCDTFEQDIAMLVKSLSPSRPENKPYTSTLYCGPFKMLILNDGTIVQRGLPLMIQQSSASALVDSGECIMLEGDMVEKSQKPVNLKDIYQKQGPVCLSEARGINFQFDTIDARDLTILDETPSEMQQRLIKLIDSNTEYFMITGSDSRDLDGCCPSDGVKSANRLVEAGILQVARTDATSGNCPVNIYAFAGEIHSKSTQPEFHINQEFRDQVTQYLQQKSNGSKKLWFTILRWTLLLFVIFSVGVMISNEIKESNFEINSFSDASLVNNLKLPILSGVVVLQFHRSQRCRFCNDMEEHTRETLNTHFPDEMITNKIDFQLVNMDLPEYGNLIKKYDLFTSTIVFIELNEGESKRWKIFNEAWYLTDNRQKFIQTLRSELQRFRDGVE